jgi:hypothetical protein
MSGFRRKSAMLTACGLQADFASAELWSAPNGAVI